MKKKTILLLTISILLLFLIGAYFYTQSNILDDQYPVYLELFNNSGIKEFSESNSGLLYIDSYDNSKCEIKHCILNDCENVITLPCSKEKANTFEQPGTYMVSLEFAKYPLFPLSSKQKLNGWKIEKVDSQEKVSEKDNYLNGIKNVVADRYIWEGMIAAVHSTKSENLDEWIYNSKPSLSHEYLKSVYLLAQIAEEINDSSLQSAVEQEIEYLNDDGKWLSNERYADAEGYILELQNYGLHEDYLDIFRQFQNLDRENVTLVPDYTIADITNNENEFDERTYEDMVLYADNYNIFKKYEYDELERFYKIVLAQTYNSSDFGLYGLCYLGNLGLDEIDINEVVEGLLEEYESNSSIEFHSIGQTIHCLRLLENEVPTETEIIDFIKGEILNSSLVIDEGSYIFNSNRITDIDDYGETSFIVLDYNLLDNIEYVY